MTSVICFPTRNRPRRRKASKAELEALVEEWAQREPPKRRTIIVGRAHAGPSAMPARFHVDYYDDAGKRRRIWSGDSYAEALRVANERFGGASEVDIREALE